MIEAKIQSLQALKSEIEKLILDEDFLYRVESNNNWFIPAFTRQSLQNIVDEYLDESKLKTWLNQYSLEKEKDKLGLILAGNIPLVGFHDLLCGYFASTEVIVKLSSKDNFLTKYILDLWTSIDHHWKSRLQIVERLVGFDKVIATGSNQSQPFFEQYFKKYNHILRKNRTSVAIVTKNTSIEEIDKLMDDIFLYFGLGCRNVTKLYVERGVELARIFEASERYNFAFNHPRYMNNYDYQRTLLLMNKVDHLSNNFLMLKEGKSPFSNISVMHYEWFDDMDQVYADIKSQSEDIQCIVSKNDIPFGQAQTPSLSDYADGVDTMEFLLN
jgi:Acyl-CoA reductase (LuxC)